MDLRSILRTSWDGYRTRVPRRSYYTNVYTWYTVTETKSHSHSKSELLATRVTPRIIELVKIVAANEGLYASEWVRMLIIKELNSRNMLSTSLPDIISEH